MSSSELNKLLLSTDEVNAVMGTRSLTAHSTDTAMADNRNLLPNLNCLGVWQVGESAIYGPSGGDNGWQGARRQMLRTPDVDTWDTLAVQSVVFYPTAEAASNFFAQSTDRWSKCTNHHVNMTVNNQPQPKLFFGNLTKTDTELSMPVTRGENERSCQRVLSVVSNIIVDVAACNHDATDQAATVAQKIKDRVSH